MIRCLTFFPFLRSGDAVCDLRPVPGGGADTAEEGAGPRQHGEAAAIPHAGGEDCVGSHRAGHHIKGCYDLNRLLRRLNR